MLEEVIELSDPQYDFITSSKRNTAFVAGMGSGKSFAATVKTILAIVNKDIPKVAYYLPTYPDVQDIAFDKFPEICNLLGYSCRLNESKKELKVYYKNKLLGTVMFRNMSNPETIVGYEVGYTVIDETDILTMEKMTLAYQKIGRRNRLITKVKDKHILEEFNNNGYIPDDVYYHDKLECLCWRNSIDVVGTPEGFKWFYNKFGKDEALNHEKEILIRATTYSNIHNLPPDYIEDMRDDLTQEQFNAYTMGIFCNLTSGSVYSYFNRETCSSNESIISNSYLKEDLYIGADFNIGGCVNVVLIERAGVYHAVDEVVSNDSFKMAEMLETRYEGHNIYLFPDASGKNRKTSATKSDLEILRDSVESIIVDPSNPQVKDRVNAMNNAFEKGYLKVNTILCPRLTEALEQQAYDKNGDPEKFTVHPAIDDFNDGIGYIIAKLFPRHKQTYKGELTKANTPIKY